MRELSKQIEIPVKQYAISTRTEKAIALLQEHVGDQPYYGCFSGGKDSVVIKALADMAGVPINWHYNVTTIDPPELVKFIREYHPDVTFEITGKHFFKEILNRKTLPTRRVR